MVVERVDWEGGETDWATINSHFFFNAVNSLSFLCNPPSAISDHFKRCRVTKRTLSSSRKSRHFLSFAAMKLRRLALSSTRDGCAPILRLLLRNPPPSDPLAPSSVVEFEGEFEFRLLD